MARGRTVGRVKTVFALLGLVSMVIIYAMVTGWNPLPSWAAWLRKQTETVLATPDPLWTVRVGDQPRAAVVLTRAIVVTTDGSVEARDPRTGDLMWSHTDSWAGVAGDTAPVVVVGKDVGSGFDVYDAASGARLWGEDSHDGVWTFADMVLVLHCPASGACLLDADNPVTGKPSWQRSLTFDGHGLRGFDASFAALVPPASTYTGALGAAPVDAPPLLGMSVDGTVHAISTTDGREIRAYPTGPDTRVVISGGTALVVTSATNGSTCRITVAARDVRTDQALWSRTGYDTGTVTGLGCDQQRDPTGGGGALLVTDPSGRAALLDVADGSTLYRAPTGDRVIATDGITALVLSGDARLLRVVALGSGRQLYTQVVDPTALIGLSPVAVLVATPAADKPFIYAYDRISSATLLNVRSGATVLGVGPASIIINIGRSIAPETLVSG